MNNQQLAIVDAKYEYTNQLKKILEQPLYILFLQIYNDNKTSEKQKHNVLIQFQRCLKNIPHWNQLKISETTLKITEKCDWFSDLLTAIFICNVKILTSIKMSTEKRKINIEMPKKETFIHTLCCECAQRFYENTDVFSSKIYKNPGRENKDEVLEIINYSIDETIRKLIPLQNILNNYINNEDPEDDEDAEDAEDIEDTEDTEDAEDAEDTQDVVEPDYTENPEEPEDNEVPEYNDTDPESTPDNEQTKNVTIQDKPVLFHDAED